MASRRQFTRELALEVFEEIARFLRPTCTRFEAVGSVRREKVIVHDLDVLAIPRIREGAAQPPLCDRAVALQLRGLIHLVPDEDGSYAPLHFVHCATGLPVDVHVAGDLVDWWGKLVVYTGSRAWLDRVRKRAHGNVCTLHDDGRVELARGKFAQPRTEKAVFRALGIPYVPPTERA